MPNSSARRSTTTPGARAAGDVRWADFVADLPALIHPAPPDPPTPHEAPVPHGSQRQHMSIAARRVHASGSHVPRGYRMRRGKPGTSLAVRPEQPAVATEPERRDPPVIHATPVAPLVLPRFGHDVRMALAPADRVFLGVMSLMGGAVMAAIVAVLALRGRGDGGALAAVPAPPSAQVAAAIAAPVAHSDSVRPEPTVLTSTVRIDTAVASAPEPHDHTRAVRDAPPREAAVTTSRSDHGSTRTARRAKAGVVTQGRSEQPVAVTTKAAPPPARTTPQPPAAVATRSAAAASTSAPVSGAATPIPAPAAQNVNVAEELRAIRTEIEARRKHVDSLAHALDSLNKAGP